MKVSFAVLSLVACLASVHAANEAAAAGKNPIRKVVTMLQSMQKKVTAEGEKAEELYEKFMCYCKTGAATLEKSIADAGTKTEELEASIKSSEEQLAQTKSSLKDAQTDRADAKNTMSEATAMRKKEAAAFASEKAELDANIGSIAKATAAIEAGMAGAFLQTEAAQALKRVASASNTVQMTDYDRHELVAFLSAQQSGGYAPQSGEITGILKTMHDEMTSHLAEITAAENAAIKEFGDLMAAKTKEVAALTKAIENKLEKSSELGVAIAQMKNDLGDTGNALIEDKKFLADLSKNCKTASADYEADVKVRTEELAALSDTIKLLNDDDALELFKKTLPGAASFLEVESSSAQMRAKALAAVQQALKAANKSERPHLDFISLALRGKKIGFDKVIKMIEEMIATLKKEQTDDDSKKEYCEEQFDTADDKKKSLEKVYADTLTAIANTEEGIATTKDEIAKLAAGIKALDASVAEATAQRKEENAAFKDLVASDTAAKELLLFAKNRLNKFYNPKLYKPPAKKELSAEDRIVENMGSAAVLVQIAQHKNLAAPPPAPALSAYKKKSEESGGVMAMMDLLLQDLEKDLTVAKTTEKDAQADYEAFLKDSQEKRTDDSKTLEDKEATQASLEADLLSQKGTKKSTARELSATMKYISSLHAECDWLIQYFGVRKEARTSEIDALGKAKAVLSGADYSFAQMQARRNLRH